MEDSPVPSPRTLAAEEHEVTNGTLNDMKVEDTYVPNTPGSVHY